MTLTPTSSSPFILNPKSEFNFAQNEDTTIFMDVTTNGTLVISNELTFPGNINGVTQTGAEAFETLIFGDTAPFAGSTIYEPVDQISVAALSGGGFVTAWLDSNQRIASLPATNDVEVEIRGNDGALLSSSTITFDWGASFDGLPEVYSFGSGFALSYFEARDMPVLRFYGPDLQTFGTPPAALAEDKAIVEDLGNGTAVVAWEGANDEAFFQLFNTGTGAPAGDQIALQDGLVDVSSNGKGFVVLGESSAELYNLDGTTHRSIPSPRQIDYQSSATRDESVLHLADGTYLILYTVNDPGETQTFGDADVFALRYGLADELLTEGPQRLNSDPDGDQGSPKGVQLANGQVAIVWTDEAVNPNTEPLSLSIYNLDGMAPSNAAPLAADDALKAEQDIAKTFSAADLTGNDTDADDDPLTVSSVTAGENGTATLNADGSVTFTPNSGFLGAARFDYTVSDGNGGEDTATVTVTVASAFENRPKDASGPAPTDLSLIRDFDGNDLGAAGDWKLIGQVDVQSDGDIEYIYVNPTIERWATIGPDANGAVDFSNHGQGGDTRVVGIYIDPLVASGEVEAFSDFDSQRRFQNDLAIDNLTVIDAFDFDGDGFQEVYFKVNDGTAYLRALMHADGNIQYANYQNTQQVEDYLTGQGFGQDVLDAILI